MSTHWRTTTFLVGLRSTGIVAPLVLDGPMTGDMLRAYIEQALAPTLSPGDMVLMDNLAAHNVTGVREAVAAAAASVLYPPPYSSDLNPIKQAFAKVKALLRRAAARTKDALWDTIGQLIDESHLPNAAIISCTQDTNSTNPKMVKVLQMAS